MTNLIIRKVDDNNYKLVVRPVHIQFRSPTIGENGNWWIDGVDTGIPATSGEGGLTPTQLQELADATAHIDGANEEKHPGNQISIVSVAFSGTLNPTINTVQKLAQAINDLDLQDGADGLTPTIGGNGNWFIGTTDTGVKAEGIDGVDGVDGVGIASIVLHATNGLVKTYRITLTNANTFDFNVADGDPGEDGISDLTQDRMYIGGEGNIPTEKTASEVNTFLNTANAITHVDGADESKHTSNQVTNTATLSNIESSANATLATISGNINARLFEQIGFVLEGYGKDVTTDSQDILKSLPYAFKAYELKAEFATAPTGGNAIITFYKNDVIIGTVTIVATEFTGSAVLDPIVSFAKGDSLSAKVTQIGITIPGGTAKAYIQGIKYQ